MIDWIDEKCRVWGRQKRRIVGKPSVMLDAIALCLVESKKLVFRGTAPSGNARGISGRLQDEGPVAAAIGNARRNGPQEVLTGDALEVSVAIQLALRAGRLTDSQHEALIAHYIVRGNVGSKAKALGIKRDAYYDRIDRAHRSIESFLDDTHSVDVDTVRCA